MAKKIAYSEKSKCSVRRGSAMGMSGKSSARCWPATSSMTTNCGSFLPTYAAARELLHTPTATSAASTPSATISGRTTMTSWGSAPGARKMRRVIMASASGFGEKSSPIDDGCKKNTAEKNAVSTPTSEPNVPGAFGIYPTPSVLAKAKASRGFSPIPWGFKFALESGVIALWQIEDHGLRSSFSELFLVKDRLANDVLFRGPRTQVQQAAAFGTKR